MDDTFRETLDSRLAVEVARNVEKQSIDFNEIVKQQLEEEMLKNVDEKIKNEVNVSLGKVSDNTEQVQINTT